jgi:hypothetical protein
MTIHVMNVHRIALCKTALHSYSTVQLYMLVVMLIIEINFPAW